MERSRWSQLVGALSIGGKDQRAMVASLDKANNGAFELVITPLVFALVGYVLDRVFGTGPVLALAFGLVGLGGAVMRLYYEYTARMKAAEEGKPWTRTPAS